MGRGDEEFVQFAGASFGGLLHTAYLLTGDRHAAEDAAQAALARTYAAWSRVRRDDAFAYARRVLVNYVTDKWRRRLHEYPTDDVPEQPERRHRADRRRPRGGPTVLYFHGGGYVAGSARTGTHLAAELARRAGGRALSVGYRLAPEHPYPAAVEDGLAAYAGLLESGASPARVLVAGDSAGGGLAVATLLAAPPPRDHQVSPPPEHGGIRERAGRSSVPVFVAAEDLLSWSD